MPTVTIDAAINTAKKHKFKYYKIYERDRKTVINQGGGENVEELAKELDDELNEINDGPVFLRIYNDKPGRPAKGESGSLPICELTITTTKVNQGSTRGSALNSEFMALFVQLQEEKIDKIRTEFKHARELEELKRKIDEENQTDQHWLFKLLEHPKISGIVEYLGQAISNNNNIGIMDNQQNNQQMSSEQASAIVKDFINTIAKIDPSGYLQFMNEITNLLKAKPKKYNMFKMML
jgi:hypothetical protein